MMRNDVRLQTRLAGAIALVLVQLAVVACDKMPLLAPTSSTVSVTSAALVLPTGGSTEVTAFVAESSGTPVQNGTVVRFTTSLGRVDPVETQTRNGLAITMFQAGDVSGKADVRATSGSSGAGTGAGAAANANMVTITIGAAAVTSISLRAAPQFVPFEGGTVQLIATVLGADNRALAGIAVTFSSSEGTLSETRVVSDAAGEARTTLTLGGRSATGVTSVTVTATAGTATSAVVTITRRPAPPIPKVSLTGARTAGTSASKLGDSWTFTATVTDTDEETRPTKFEWDFGDGTEETTTTGSATHVYTTGGVVRIVTVRVTLFNGTVLEARFEFVLPALPLV